MGGIADAGRSPGASTGEEVLARRYPRLLFLFLVLFLFR